jgi:PD-(D/E)XK nuclease superfamily
MLNQCECFHWFCDSFVLHNPLRLPETWVPSLTSHANEPSRTGLAAFGYQSGYLLTPLEPFRLQGVFSGGVASRRIHHTALISRIALEVYQNLGAGFSEDVYDRAMQVGLRLAGIGTKARRLSN